MYFINKRYIMKFFFTDEKTKSKQKKIVDTNICEYICTI